MSHVSGIDFTVGMLFLTKAIAMGVVCVLAFD